jgi:hypothetical protein
MENYQTETNSNPDIKEKMALDWAHPEETNRVH